MIPCLSQDACTVLDVKRMIEQPGTTTALSTIVCDTLVFALSLPYVGKHSVPVQQLQSWVQKQWDLVPSDLKKSGRKVPPTHIAAVEVEDWFLDPFKATCLEETTTCNFTETYTAADNTTWCNVHSATVAPPHFYLESIQLQQNGAMGATTEVRGGAGSGRLVL
jgi:hypothetical protein